MDGADNSQAEELWELTVKEQLSAPLEKVWELVSDFVHIDRWMPGVTSKLGPGPGVVRICAAQGYPSAASNERLVSLDSDNHCLAYTVDVNPIKLKDYQAEVRLTQGDQPGTTLLSWGYKMPPNPETSKEEVARKVGHFFRSGIEGLKAVLQGPAVDGSSPVTQKPVEGGAARL